jgi:glucose/arabinose dehydrogenase
VTATIPAVGAQNVALDAFISCEVNIPNGGIDAATINAGTVYLINTRGGEVIPAIVNTTGAGDAIILKPVSKLLAKTNYTFFVTSGVKDVTGAAFAPFQMTFHTGTGTANKIDPEFKNVKFENVQLPNTPGVARYLGVLVGPDHKVYASTDDGRIFRFPINDDGTLGTPDIITTIRDHAKGPRFVVGMAFDPASTPDNPMLWVSYTAAGVIGTADFTGTIARLDGQNLENITDVIVHLPRSARDHVTGQLQFGPDGALYFCQPSNTATGAPDAGWAFRPEHLLTAAILRLDTAVVNNLPSLPIDVRTKDAGGSYDPYASGAPLTIYATGVRNAYDILWHSNGQLYAPVNGSAAGGATPASPDGKIPGIPNVSSPEFDILYHIVKGRYYGHPNPFRNEYVLDGGNPTSGNDVNEIPQYPVGIIPPANWRSGIFNFGLHESPDGLTEYKSGSFGGVLQGKILVCEYSAGDDIVVLEPSSDRAGIFKSQAGISSLSGFHNPLDLSEDQTTGNLYVIEYNASGATSKITLLRVPADQRAPAATPDPTPPPNPDPPPPPDPTPTPTPEPTPTPTPPPPYRSPQEQRLVAKIQTFVAVHGLPQVDLTYIPGVQLKSILADEKVKLKIVTYSGRSGMTPPDLSQAWGAQLKTIFAGEKAEVHRRKYAAKVTALAAKKKYPLPDLSSMTIDQLKELASVIKHTANG